MERSLSEQEFSYAELGEGISFDSTDVWTDLTESTLIWFQSYQIVTGACCIDRAAQPSAVGPPARAPLAWRSGCRAAGSEWQDVVIDLAQAADDDAMTETRAEPQGRTSLIDPPDRLYLQGGPATGFGMAGRLNFERARLDQVASAMTKYLWYDHGPTLTLR